MSLKDYYVEEERKVVGFIGAYQKNYGLSDLELDISHITFEQYKEERLRLCGIKNEGERMKQTALLEVRVLKHHLQGLTNILFGIGERHAN